MTALFRTGIFLALLMTLATCGDSSARYMLDAPAPQDRVRVRVASIEVREVTLPAYAAASEMMIQGEDGSLRAVANAVWADDPVRAVTISLARNIDLVSTATAAAEPWPLEEPANVRIEVRIDRMVAQKDNQFLLSGQFSVAAPEAAVRESINRFEILQPLTDETPQSIAGATGAALMTLSRQIVERLKR